jgi:hypothetical protein
MSKPIRIKEVDVAHLLKLTLFITLVFGLCAPGLGLARHTADATPDVYPQLQHRSLSALVNKLITAPTKSMCKEACWAQSASTKDLREKYGSGDIPARFKFADRFYRKGEAVYVSCMRPHGPMGIMNKSVSRQCTEKANRVCAQACKAALKK